MTEWAVVGVIVVLVGLIVTVITPVVKLTKAITRVEILVETMLEQTKSDKEHNSESHRRIFSKLEDHDERLHDHQREIDRIKERDGITT